MLGLKLVACGLGLSKGVVLKARLCGIVERHVSGCRGRRGMRNGEEWGSVSIAGTSTT